jgi:hypothetical protein
MTRGRGQSIGRAYHPNETQYARWGSAYRGHYHRHRPFNGGEADFRIAPARELLAKAGV